jgi:PhzF family phenazine biosynthesis protein
MTTVPEVRRYAAFSHDPAAGNPAGVVLDAAHLTDAHMQRIAAEVGYSETAFVTGPVDVDRATPIPTRYFAPEGEVDFCGHATVAAAVAIGEVAGAGDYSLQTRVGPIRVSARFDHGRAVGTLRSPDVDCFPLAEELLAALLEALRWSADDLDPELAPAIGFGGNRHPVLVAGDLRRLTSLSYDFAALQHLCRREDWVTVHLVVPTGGDEWRARDPFPWGGVVEDPATGAAAAAFAGYLRSRGRATTGDRFVITQGVEMGRPSRIEVELLERAARIAGYASRIDHDGAPTPGS